MADKIVKGTLSVFSGQTVALIIGFILAPILVRILGEGGYGDYAVLLSIVTILLVSIEAVSTGIRKYIAEDRTTPNWAEYVCAYHFRLGLIFTIFGVLLLLIMNIFNITSRLFDERFITYFYVICLVLIAQSIHYITRYTLLGLYLEFYSELLFAFQRLLFAIIGVLLAYLGFGVIGVFTGMALAATVASIIAFVILKDHVDFRKIIEGTPAGFPNTKMLRYTLSNLVLTLLSLSLFNIDILILQYFTESVTVGIYKAALTVAEYLMFVPIAIQVAYIHSTSELWSKGEIDRINQLASRTTRYTAIFSVLLIIGLAVLAEPFMLVYFGGGFGSAVLPLLILLPGALGWALARPIYSIGQGKGTLRPLIVSTGVAALLNAGLNMLLIPVYGMVGAAVATSIGYGSMLVFHIASARKLGFNPINDLRVGRILFSGLSTGLIILFLTDLTPSLILSLIVIPPVGFMIYSIVIIKTAAIEPDEIHQISDSLPPPLNHYVRSAIEIVV